MQIADRVRRLHGRNDAQLLEPGNVERIHDLRVLDAPARICDLALIRRDSFQSLLVLVENEAITSIADSVRLTLNAFAQSFLEHGQEIFFLDGQTAGSVGSIWIKLEQCRAARTE